MYIARNNTLFYAFLIAITVESIGVLSPDSIRVLLETLMKNSSVLGAIVVPYLFGFGIVLRCATGTVSRVKVSLGSWVALFFI